MKKAKEKTYDDNYYRKIIKDVRILNTVNDEFIKDINHIRQTSSISLRMADKKEEKSDEEIVYVDIHDTNIPKLLGRFREDIVQLRTKYNLSQAYHEPINSLILEDWVDCKMPHAYYDVLKPFQITDQLTGEKIVVLKLHGETSLADIQSAWTKISKDRDELLKIKRAKMANRGGNWGQVLN